MHHSTIPYNVSNYEKDKGQKNSETPDRLFIFTCIFPFGVHSFPLNFKQPVSYLLQFMTEFDPSKVAGAEVRAIKAAQELFLSSSFKLQVTLEVFFVFDVCSPLIYTG